MKRKNRLTAILAGAVMLCSAVPVTPANAFEWYWGTAASDAYSEMTVLDDHGMLRWIARKGADFRDYQVVTQHESRDIEVNANYPDENVVYAVTGTANRTIQHVERDLLWVIMPRTHTLRIVLCPDLDEREAQQQAEAIIRKYESDSLSGGNLTHTYFDRVFEVTDSGTDAPSEALADAMMLDLAKAGLISAFYAWGQTADYQYVEPDVLTFDAYRLDESDFTTQVLNFDLETVNAYLSEYAQGCTAEENADENGQMLVNGVVVPFRSYRITVREDMTYAEQFAIVADLYAEYGYAPRLMCPETASDDIAAGQNALTIKGDLNLDRRVTVADAVMLARLTAEDQAVSITDAGLANADIDRNGSTNAQDVTALLKAIAGIK